MINSNTDNRFRIVYTNIHKSPQITSNEKITTNLTSLNNNDINLKDTLIPTANSDLLEGKKMSNSSPQKDKFDDK